jgi:CHAD domain-containing protein
MRGDQPLAEAGVALLGDRLKKASKLVKRAAKGDADGVHDLRIAIRKIRAALSVLEETLLDRGALRKDDKKLARLFSALGDVRDHDVLVDRVKRITKQHRLGKKGVAGVRAELDGRGRRATKHLRRVMHAEDPVRLFAKIGRHVARTTAKSGPRGDDHRVLVRHFASSVLVVRYEAVLAYEVVLPASIEVLHRLRVAIKKLRYAIDFFGGALGKRAPGLDQPLQTAQDQLGELHDHHVGRALVAGVERNGKPKRALANLRDVEDGEAEQLLAVFARSWQTLARGRFATLLARSTEDLLGQRMRSSTLALRRAESGL